MCENCLLKLVDVKCVRTSTLKTKYNYFPQNFETLPGFLEDE